MSRKQTIQIDGTSYSGIVVSSTKMSPSHHWFVSEDLAFTDRYGNQVGFVFTGGDLKPIDTDFARKHPQVIKKIKDIIYKNLFY